MRDRQLEQTSESRNRVAQQSEDRHAEMADAAGNVFPRRDPLSQVARWVGDAANASAHAAMLNRAAAERPARAVPSLLQLQRQYGNRYVQRVLALMRKGKGNVALEVEQAIQRTRGGGQALVSSVRAQMEPIFGADFSGLRVHTDAEADILNRALNARAFTTGQDIFFRQGAYSPSSSSGRELLAHELTHVVQQNGDEVRSKLKASQPGDSYEREADEVAREVNQHLDGQRMPAQEQEEEEEESVRTDFEDGVQRLTEEEEEEETVPAKVENVSVSRQIEEKKEKEPIQASVAYLRSSTNAGVARKMPCSLDRKIYPLSEDYPSSPDIKYEIYRRTHNIKDDALASTSSDTVVFPDRRRRRRRSRHIRFEDIEGTVINVPTYDLAKAGRDPYDVIQDHVSQVATALNNMRTGQLGAINQFLTHMAFSSSTEAQPDVLGAVFKYVGKQIWEAAIGKLPSVAGVPGSQVIKVINAMTDELERAAAAQTSYELMSFMAVLRNATLTAYQNSIATLETSARRDLERQFSEKDGSWTRGSTIVTGGKAQFLRELDRRGEASLLAVPQPIEYEQALIVKWATDRRAGAKGVGKGRIVLEYDTEERNGRYTYNFESAKLFTATKSGQAADMLTRVMRMRNLKVYELGIPVLVKLKTEGMVPGGRSYYGFLIRSRTDYTESHWWPPADRAWQNMPWEPIDKVREVKGE